MLLGNPPFTGAVLTSTIIEAFPFHSPDGDQANFLGRALESLGQSLGYKVVRGQSSHGRKVPLDISWWEPGRGTVLAARACWGVAGEVGSVLPELMAVKAPMKLLIFRSRSVGNERQDVSLRSDIDAVLMALGAAVLDFAQHLEGETYVLLERVDQQAIFRGYEFRVPVTGKLTIDFQQAARIFLEFEMHQKTAVCT